MKIISIILTFALTMCLFVGCKDSEAHLSKLAASEIPEFTFGSGTENVFVQDDRYVTKATDTTVEDYNTYLNSLTESGFEVYAENKIGENLFATLKNRKTVVTLSYMKNDAVTMVIAEPRTYLYPRQDDNKYESKSIQSVFTGFRGETVVATEGMGFIIRLSDGSFIIVDSGQGDPDSIDSTKLYNILKEQSPEGTKKPVIAAWIFTHCHGDHVGVFNTFSIDYRDKVVIESFYGNFPTEEDILNAESYLFDDSIYRYNQFKKAMTEYYPNVPKIRSYAGNKYYIRNAEIEVLYSYEHIYPSNFEKDEEIINATSLIFTVSIEGQRFMITGDAEDAAMGFAERNYGDYLKSDFLQMAHHGLNGNLAFYSAVDPKYAIMPVSYPAYNLINEGEANIWLRDSENVRQFIEFAKQTVSIPLPYNPSDDEIQKIPDSATRYPTYPSLKIETIKPADTVPQAWFDLGFKNGKPYDKLGNLTVTMPKGTVGKTTVNYNNKSYNVTAFTGDSNGEGLLVELPFENETEYANWLLGGCTFELFVQVDKRATGTSAFFNNIAGGGAGLYYRASSGGYYNQLQFQIGSTNHTSATYNWQNYAAAAPSNIVRGPVTLDEKCLRHCVGTYDKKTNTLSLYYNGILVSSGSYGDGEFKLGNASYNVLGIGINPPDPSESFGEDGSFTILGAKLYKTALTEAEVLKEFNDSIFALSK